MTVQIEHQHFDLERMKQETARIQQDTARIQDEVERSRKLYRLEVWKIVVAAAGAAGVIGGVIGHFLT